MRKKICIVTGSRAEYGLLRPLLKIIKSKKEFDLQIIATGMHLSPEFGLTYREIEKDGFAISEKVATLLSSDTEAAISKSIGKGCIGFADAFKRLKPDLVIVLGDRFEILSSAVSAFVRRIPIAHIHGGEATEGVIDDAFRYSITKMSFLHFTATEKYRRRIVRLGESPGRVFTVGALGIDNIKTLKLLGKEDLEKNLHFRFGCRTALAIFHPVTLENATSKAQFIELLKALDSFRDLKIIFIKPNADTHGRIISSLIDRYVSKNPEKSVSFISLNTLAYLSILKCVDVIVGNSSSGIMEAPELGRPTVNIGDRQKGRIRARSVIDCQPFKKSIRAALEKALSEKFSKSCAHILTPYGDGRAAMRIYKIIKRKIKLIKSLKKSFYEPSG